MQRENAAWGIVMTIDQSPGTSSLGTFDPSYDTAALPRMAIYDDLRAKGDVHFSEQFEWFWVITKAKLMRDVLPNPQLFSSTATQPADPHPT